MGSRQVTAVIDSAAGVVIEGLIKHYGDVVALSGLSLNARPGEILGIAGPNGAGKSTMVKVMAGEVLADAGDIRLGGSPWTPQLGADRVAIVHQEPQLFPNLTVAENLMAGREASRAGKPRLQPEDVEILRDTGLLASSNKLLADLPLALQQRTEIARALVRSADVFLFDEPNSALTEDESEELFARMHAIADSGRVVLLVTHRLAELAHHADRVAIIIDGSCRAEFEPPELSADRIARELVIGRVGTAGVTRLDRTGDQTSLLALESWTHHFAKFTDVALTLNRGEIVAVVGVEGSGGRELVRSVGGFEPASGEFVEDPSIGASGAKVAFVAADRADSLFDNLSVAENLCIRSSTSICSRWGLVNKSATRRLAEQARADFSVKVADLTTPVRSLSGGNQQKVAIASALTLNPALVVLEEPTRGVDVTSKAEIYRLLRNFADGGGGVLLYCTEDSEVFDVADRTVVVSQGKIVGEVACAHFAVAEALAEHLAVMTTGASGNHEGTAVPGEIS